MLNNNRSGYNNVAEYQVSGVPWVTSSVASGVKRHRFSTLDEPPGVQAATLRWDRVTKWIIVKNRSTGSMDVSFTLNGFASSNYFTLDQGESFSGDLRVTEIWVSGSAAQPYVIVAGLTGVNAEIPQLTGSLGHPGIG